MTVHAWPEPPASSLASHWDLDPDVVFLNHGSFGACPREVLRHQQALRAQLERQPVHFMTRVAMPLLEGAVAACAQFVGCNADDLCFVLNATTGVNTVLRAIALEPGDEVLTTQHVYNACRNAMDFVAARRGARVVVAQLPWPCHDEAALLEAWERHLTPSTRLALIDHVTSATGVALPAQAMINACRNRGVDTLVDGAHAPGMVPLDLKTLGATYYTGNCHKWLCAPKGAALLYVERASQADVWPLVIGHGYNAPLGKKSRFRECFDWPGTHDPTAAMCVPLALRVLEKLVPGGWPAIYAHNHAMVVAARAHLCALWNVPPPAPDAMLGSLAAMPLPLPATANPSAPDPLYEALRAQRIEVPVYTWPGDGKRYLRISAQLYNTRAQFELLGERVLAHLQTSKARK